MSSLPAQLQEALLDPSTEMVQFGPRPTLARQVVRMASSAALYAAVGAGLYLGGAHLSTVSGLTAEISSRANPMQTLPQVPQQIKWLDMPSSPFMDVGYRPDGTFSVDRLVGAYKASGLTVGQAQDVAVRLRALSPVLMGANDQELASSLQKNATEISQSLLKDYPVQAKRLSLMIKERTVPTSRAAGVWNTPQNWAEVRAEVLRSGHLSADEDDVQGLYPDMSLQEARGHLEVAVQGTGLRALRVPAISWSSPQKLFDLARGLEQANADLEDATSWEGQVLGLGGRVVLTMGTPPVDTGAAGLTSAFANGYIQIQAQWDNLGHEWFHGVDFLAAQHALQVSGVQSLSEQLQPLRIKKNSAVIDAWKVAVWKTVATTPQWQEQRAEIISEHEKRDKDHSSKADTSTGARIRPASYWESNVEQLAYAFQASINASQSTILKPFTGNGVSHAMPSEEEAKALAPVWRDLFVSMKPLELSRPMAVAATMEGRVAARRTPGMTVSSAGSKMSR